MLLFQLINQPINQSSDFSYFVGVGLGKLGSAVAQLLVPGYLARVGEELAMFSPRKAED